MIGNQIPNDLTSYRGKDRREGKRLRQEITWSGTRLNEGAKASVEAVKKVGKSTAKGSKTGTEKVDKWSKGIGDGIEDLGRKL